MSWLKRGYGYIEDGATYLGRTVGLLPEQSPARAESLPVSTPEAVEEGPGMLNRLFGGLSGLRGGAQGGSKEVVTKRGLPPPGTYTVGEVHADYVKVSHQKSLGILGY